MPRAAVVLSGCGVFDGSDIHEAVAVLLHLNRLGVQAVCFEPNKPQMHLVDHAAHRPVPGTQRNVLSEAARISRGHIPRARLGYAGCTPGLPRDPEPFTTPNHR